MVQVVNLLVTPTQAEQLSLASNQTTIQLVLRNPLDHDIAKTPGTALHNLFNMGKPMPTQPSSDATPRPRSAPRMAAPITQAAPPPAAPKEAPFTMEIISGAAKSEKKFTAAQEAK